MWRLSICAFLSGTVALFLKDFSPKSLNVSIFRHFFLDNILNFEWSASICVESRSSKLRRRRHWTLFSRSSLSTATTWHGNFLFAFQFIFCFFTAKASSLFCLHFLVKVHSIRAALSFSHKANKRIDITEGILKLKPFHIIKG
jgi:hypothetical protein